MHNGALKKWALALTFWLALHTSSLRAQILGPYGTAPTTFEVDANGLLSDTGTFGTGTLSFSGAGTRMIWYPGKAAFRAGSVSGTEWDDTYIGQYSFASGSNTEADGSAASALGVSNTASGYGSSSLGGYNSSTAEGSTTLGAVESATGMFSTALGGYNTASGYASVALNAGNIASGSGSTASGFYTTASAFDLFVAGRYNVGGGSPTTWVTTDPLFEIGDGTSPTATADAFVVYKNGNAQVQGTLRCSPGGDLSMGSFTAGTLP